MSKFEPVAATINVTITPPDDFANEVADTVIAKLNRKNTWDRAQLLLVEWVSLYATHTSAQPELKLEEEVEEFLEAEHDTDDKLKEAADVFIVLASQLTFEGYTIDDLANAVQEKLGVNLARTWKLNDTGTISHVKPEPGFEQPVFGNDEDVSDLMSDDQILLDER